MNEGPDAVIIKILLKPVPVLGTNNEEVPDMEEIGERRAESGGQYNLRIFNIIDIELSDLAALLVIGVKMRQFCAEDCSLDLIEAGIQSFIEVLVLDF